MATERAQINCVAIIAGLEGKNRLILPEDPVSSSSLAELSTRVRRLETQHGITLPPPSLSPTWDSLALRICRVQQKSHAKYPRTKVADNSFAFMIPDGMDVSVETLQTLCSDLCRPRPPLFSVAAAMPWPKCASDEEMLDVIRQRLCHSAGAHGILVAPIPITRIEIYAQLVALTLKIEEPEPQVRPGMPPVGMGGMRAPGAAKKSCCGCCLCYCHNNVQPGRSVLPRDTGKRWPNIINVQPRRRKSAGFGWLKKLAFWRRSKYDDDWSSTTSGRSSTIVD
ncbi:hypothetical protein QQX98_005526 [Neonectria punicea]|uniref:Uncharacterized protein n=1 Tax=Neonectria punicea TaxID=979145 RepID=A0ABR1H4X3_9HYPO